MGVFNEILERIERYIIGIASNREVRLDAKTLIQTEEQYYRKFVASLVYCHGIKRAYYALTYENNDIDREEELLDAIRSETSESCSDIRDNHGYSHDIVEEPGSDAIYPNIEVGIE